MDSKKLFQAATFAAQKHTGQFRKGSAHVPYINHPLQVADLLAHKGEAENTNLLIAALLHDVIEDTQTQPDEIEQMFGKEVLDIVLEVSDDKNLPKEIRKQKQIEKAAHLSPSAQKLKIADKICNLKDIIEVAPNWPLWRKLDYYTWAENVVGQMKGKHPVLEGLFYERLAQGREVLLTRKKRSPWFKGWGNLWG